MFSTRKWMLGIDQCFRTWAMRHPSTLKAFGVWERKLLLIERMWVWLLCLYYSAHKHLKFDLSQTRTAFSPSSYAQLFPEHQLSKINLLFRQVVPGNLKNTRNVIVVPSVYIKGAEKLSRLVTLKIILDSVRPWIIVMILKCDWFVNTGWTLMLLAYLCAC